MYGMTISTKPRTTPKMKPRMRSIMPMRLSRMASDRRAVMRCTTMSTIRKMHGADDDLRHGDLRAHLRGHVLRKRLVEDDEVEHRAGRDGPRHDRQHFAREAAVHGEQTGDEADRDECGVEIGDRPQHGLQSSVARRFRAGPALPVSRTLAGHRQAPSDGRCGSLSASNRRCPARPGREAQPGETPASAPL